MRVTTKGRYALRAITKLALEAGDKPMPIKKIARDEELSPEFLEQIFFRLKKAGIISSMRGPGGGFVMKQDPESVTVKAIFDAVGEGIELTPCTSYQDDGAGECTRKDECLVHDMWEEASEHIIQYFESLTLKKIMDKNESRDYDNLVEKQEFSV
jgi:Rrf2 family iron-sulfur cluster assembly transcriptional regulator